MSRRGFSRCDKTVNFVLLTLFILSGAKVRLIIAQQDEQSPGTNQSPQIDLQARQAPPSWSTSPPSLQPPNPIASASYLSLDGLSLVIIFDKPVNLSTSIESVERRIQAANSEILGGDSSQRDVVAVRPQTSQRFPRAPGSSALHVDADDQSMAVLANGQDLDGQKQLLDSSGRRLNVCSDPRLSLPPPETNNLVQGIQICAKLLTKKTLKLLHKYRLYNCVWPTQVQFIIQLAKSVPINPPAPNASSSNSAPPVRVAFKRSSLASSDGYSFNEREVSVELNRLPLEGFGVPLAPKLALTGPNQVPPCGQFTLSAHLSSPYGTQASDSVNVSWTVERIGLTALNGNQIGVQSGNSSMVSSANQSTTSISANDESVEIKWRALQQLVAGNKGNNLVLDAQLLQQQPQIYLFYVTAVYATSLATVSLNATHQVGKIDFEAPIGTIYGSHLLSNQPNHLMNPSQEIALLADVQVPECANNIKQVGVYWQVSDSRVKFEQTYAPFYLIKKNALPEQAQVEFRLNLFYGIRVKKYASAGTLVSTSDSILDASINDGTLIMSIGSQHDSSRQLELYAAGDHKEADRYTYQWSCFDGKTAQQCIRDSQSTNSTRYEIGSILAPSLRQPIPSGGGSSESNDPRGPFGTRASSPQSSTPLLDRQHQRQSTLRLPLTWLEPEAQLWFGLQRFDRQQVVATANGQQVPQAKTEYALVSLQQPTVAGPTLSIGPVLVGHLRRRATIRNPLTGAMVLIAGAPVVIVGRLSPSYLVGSFAWHMQNGVQPLHWTVHNSTNQVTGEQELVSELHLNPSLLVAHAHHQVQLIACSRSNGAKNSASLSLDIVQSISQCRVEASRSPIGNALVVSVEFCNIPLGLSPASYQIYSLDTTSSDGFIEANRAQEPRDLPADEYANEADESYLESQAEPLSMAQLSPVFVLNGISGALGPLATLGTAGQPLSPRASLRFAARVCDRLQSCRMFYSAPVGLEQLSGPASWSSGRQPANLTTSAGRPVAPPSREELERSQSVALQSMLDGARRANVAGNSIAAIAVLNGVITLAGKTLQAIGRQQSERLVSAEEGSPPVLPMISKLHEEKLREISQLATRECLHYTQLSLQRQFHYTDSGQTNLVTQTLAKILGATSSGLEFKFRALRLLAQVTKRSINQALLLRVNCLADSRSLQSGYESVFGTFSQHSVSDSNQQDLRLKSHHQAQHSLNKQRHNNNNNNTDNPIRSAATVAPFALGPDSSDPMVIVSAISPNRSSPSSGQTSSRQPLALAQHQQPLSANHQSAGSRHKREEAILAYLRSARHSYRALVAAAAVQLPLGATHQLAYFAGDQQQQQQATSRSGAGASAEAASQVAPQTVTRASSASPSARVPAKLAPPFGFPSAPRSSQARSTPAKAQLLSAAATTTPTQTQQVAVLSSLAHQTQLSPTDPIDVDLNEFGSVSISFLDQVNLASRLRSQLERRQLRCRNGSVGAANSDRPTACASFVLALTTFSGKAPFRSLDEGVRWLRVPVVELSLLSPLDGSNLQDAMAAGDDPAALQPADFKVSVTYTLPPAPQAPNEGQINQQSGGDGNNSAEQKSQLKCYRFSEERNEWILSSLQPNADEIIMTSGADDSNVLNAEQQMRKIKCSFDRLGVYGAFHGKPPASESSAQLTIVLSLVGVFGLVTVLSILGCFASKRSDGSRDHLGDSSATPTTTSSSGSDISHGHHQASASARVHQAFGKYPL